MTINFPTQPETETRSWLCRAAATIWPPTALANKWHTRSVLVSWLPGHIYLLQERDIALKCLHPNDCKHQGQILLNGYSMIKLRFKAKIGAQ